MRRLGVFVFYDSEGYVDRYIEFLLALLKRNLQELVIIINGDIIKESYLRLLNYTSHVYKRANIGFDAGAYKDFFLNNLCEINWKNYDEIVMLNDTFYGPLVELERVFGEMQQENIDFWGITRHPEGMWTGGQVLPTHIQGYFLAVKRKMLQSEDFFSFWKDISYPEDYQSAIQEFEIAFTVFFERRGFVGKARMDLKNKSCLFEKGKNPYLLYNLELLSELKIPFLKKKSLAFETPGYINSLDALEYIERETTYDVSMIWENIFRLSREGSFQSLYNYWELENFYNIYERIYIYGAGVYGKKIQRYFQYRNWVYETFLVTNTEDTHENCIAYAEAKIDKNTGVILALGEKNLNEVLKVIGNDIARSQMLLPRYH